MPQVMAAVLERQVDAEPLSDFRVPLSETRLAQMRKAYAECLFPIAKSARDPSELPPDLAPLIQSLGRHFGWQLPSIS